MRCGQAWVDDAGGTRFVRYHLIPAAGEKFLGWRTALAKESDYLTEELAGRLAEGLVRFYFRVQIAGPGDSTVDPSARWRSETMVTVGNLDITGIDTERERGDDMSSSTRRESPTASNRPTTRFYGSAAVPTRRR